MDTRSLWTYRGIFALLALVFVFLRLLPFGESTNGVPGPDLFAALVAAWVLRRPDYVPIGLLVIMGILTDALLNNPLGLWTLILLLMAEVLRRTVHQTVSLTPYAEATIVVPALIAAFVIERVVLTILVAPTPPLGVQTLHVIITIFCYPAVVILSHAVLGVRRLQPGELDSLGTRA